MHSFLTGDGCLVSLWKQTNLYLFRLSYKMAKWLDDILTISSTAQISDDWMDFPQVSDPNATEHSSTVTETVPPPLRRSTSILVPPKRYGQHENTST